MKYMFAFVVLIMISLSGSSQSYNLKWGDEIKLKKGTTDIDIVAADNTGLYFTEARVRMKAYFVIGASYGSSYKLYKVDKNFSEVFEKEYKKELRGLDFHSFQSLGQDLFMFATDYEKKDKLFKVYGAKVDKTTGDLVGDFTEIGSYQLESKKDDYEMKMSVIENGAAFLMVSNISAKDKVTLGISVLDKNFAKKQSSIIQVGFNPGFYALQDVKLAAGNKIVLLGKEFEETTVGKKKRKSLVFKNYLMSVYAPDGSKENDVSMATQDRFVINGKLIEQPSGGLLLAGFYSNTSKKDDLNGFFINKLDAVKGELTLSSFKEINASMLGKNFADEGDDDEETKESKKQAKKAKDEDEEDELPNEFIIRSVDINPVDNSIIITSEVSQYTHYSYTTSNYNTTTRSWNYTTYEIHRFNNKDILVINADKDGNIRWLNAIPKSQQEEIRSSNNSGGRFYFYTNSTDYFATGGGMPYYSSFSSLLHNNSLIILMNDHTSNNMNVEYGDKVRTVYNFRKRSNAYAVAIDLATGKMNRKFIGSNNDETILMPRHAMVIKNELFLPSWRQHALAKTELRFAKIAVK